MLIVTVYLFNKDSCFFSDGFRNNNNIINRSNFFRNLMFQVRTENIYRSPKRIFVLPELKNSTMVQNQPTTILTSPRSCFSDHPPKNGGFWNTNQKYSKI